MLGLRVSALGSRGGATDHFPKRDRLPASPISSAQAAPGPCFLTGSRCHHEADGHGSQGAHQHSRIASFSPHRWDGGAVPDWFFKMSRSIRTVRSSRRKRPSSSRSSVVSAPAGPWPASIPACRTQARTALSVRPSSRATTPMDFPLSRINRTVSALNSSVNARRLRLAMEHSYRTFVRSAVSTKPGQLHDAHERADVDDHPALVGAEVRQDRPDDVDRTAHVDVELPIDRALFREFERAIRACAGVVDDHVDAAERRACLLDRRCDLRAIGDVELEEANVVVGRELALLLGRSHRRGDVPSLLSEVLRSELAESSARTCDQDRLWHFLLLYGPFGPEVYTRTSHDYSRCYFRRLRSVSLTTSRSAAGLAPARAETFKPISVVERNEATVRGSRSEERRVGKECRSRW